MLIIVMVAELLDSVSVPCVSSIKGFASNLQYSSHIELSSARKKNRKCKVKNKPRTSILCNCVSC